MNGVLAIGLLGVAVYTDWKAFRIYNKHVLIGLVAGLLYHLCIGGIPGLQAGLIAGFAGGLILFPAWLFGAIGGGDVKLYAVLGAIMGFPFLIKTTLWLSFFCLLWAVSALIWKKRFLVSMKWTIDYLKFLVFKIAFLGLKEKEEPIVEDGIKIKFAFVIAAAVLTSMLTEGVGWFEAFF